MRVPSPARPIGSMTIIAFVVDRTVRDVPLRCDFAGSAAKQEVATAIPSCEHQVLLLLQRISFGVPLE